MHTHGKIRETRGGHPTVFRLRVLLKYPAYDHPRFFSFKRVPFIVSFAYRLDNINNIISVCAKFRWKVYVHTEQVYDTPRKGNTEHCALQYLVIMYPGCLALRELLPPFFQKVARGSSIV